jgi:pilus assembly protein Flp/PilA
MSRALRRFLADPAGATAIEYALIAAVVAIMAITGLLALGGGSNSMWGMVGGQVVNALGGG